MNTENEKKKKNTCGIIGCCVGWLIPIAGLTLGIISLARGEPNKTLGILGIVISVIFWVINMIILA